MTTASRAAPLALVLALGLAGTPAQAQLIKDTEARKAIADLEARFKASAAAQDAQLVARKTEADQLAEQLVLLRKSITDMGAELTKMQEEATRLRTSRSETATQLAELRRQLDDDGKNIQARMQALEPVAVVTDAGTVQLPVDEARQHDEAMKLMKAADYERAAPALAAFVKRYPTSPVLPSVRFWLGNAYYAQKNFAEALAQFRAMVAAAPEHPRAPAAWLAIANCHLELKNVAAARKALEDAVRLYPNHESAATAKERLALLRG